MAALLELVDLAVSFPAADGNGFVRAADGVNLEVPAGTTVGLVGESGSGKTVTALSILRLLDPPARVTGAVRFGGNNLLELPERELRAIRGNRIAMVFQDPMTSLNPVLTVGEQIAEVVRLHEKRPRRAAWARAVEMLETVGISSPAERARAYPHELSGGMRQRVMIGMALACKPDLLIADEPTTALDVTIQAQILELLRRLRAEMGMSVLLITHDLGVVAETCDLVNVMYAGRIVERAPVARIFATPRHPYTLGLLSSMPDFAGPRRLRAIPGAVPLPGKHPPGCRFADRCERVLDRCRAAEPTLEPADGDAEHLARCINLVPREALSGPVTAGALL
ncbi:MAG: peptide ABC transporter ATP-binding protein [Deltaproteobacteria bacterium RBG_16_71_12]|nr:MAG: peptide ABC transporter ATP-binding protein [Deltaproteobacteria bacterium RBG_16_71_12]